MVVLIIVETELIMVEMVTQVELIMHRSGDEDEDAEPENCAAPLTCKEKVSSFWVSEMYCIVVHGIKKSFCQTLQKHPLI